MDRFYAFLAGLGATVPMLYFVGAFHGDIVPLASVPDVLFANSVAGGLTSDLFIASAAFWAYILSRDSGPKPWPFMVLNLLVGLSFALPLYLYFECRRARKSS
ncbi:MAG: hypothetical protein Aurels2KO_35930 [Aureliella sp.]